MTIHAMLAELANFHGRRYNDHQIKEIPKYIPEHIKTNDEVVEMACNILIRAKSLPGLKEIEIALRDAMQDWDQGSKALKQKQMIDCRLCGGLGTVPVAHKRGGHWYFSAVKCNCPNSEGTDHLTTSVTQITLPYWDQYQQAKKSLDWIDSYRTWVDLVLKPKLVAECNLLVHNVDKPKAMSMLAKEPVSIADVTRGIMGDDECPF